MSPTKAVQMKVASLQKFKNCTRKRFNATKEYIKDYTSNYEKN